MVCFKIKSLINLNSMLCLTYTAFIFSPPTFVMRCFCCMPSKLWNSSWWFFSLKLTEIYICLPNNEKKCLNLNLWLSCNTVTNVDENVFLLDLNSTSCQYIARHQSSSNELIVFHLDKNWISEKSLCE